MLDIRCCGTDARVSLFFEQLAGHYAGQLRRFNCDYPAALPQDRRFAQLRRVWITGRETGDYTLPYMDPAILEELCIYNAPPSFDLGVFGTGNGSSDIVFAALERFELSYRQSGSPQPTHQEVGPRRFHFPHLRNVHIRCHFDRCSAVENAVFPAAVDSFSIAGSSVLLPAVAAMPLPSTRDLDVYVVRRSGSTRNVFAAVDGILSSTRPSHKVQLCTQDERLPVPPECIAFFGLTKLVIYAPTRTRTIFELVQKLPRLVILAVFTWTLDDFLPDIAVPAPAEHEPIPPFNTKIRALHLGRQPLDEGQEQATLAVQYMMLRMPSLMDIYVDRVSAVQLGAFVSGYSRWYPHLPSVDMNIQ
ncbi:hypothetical protein IWQ56_003279 [Coemansia nantahalensis]|nr:hypothetical protein IWQ56_003279 [Coemansia nantahalensis]